MKTSPLAAPPFPELSQKELKKLVDALGANDAKVATLEDLKRQGDQMRAQLRTAYAAAPAEGAFSLQGKVYTCTIGAAGNVRSIVSMPAVYETVGEAAFLKNCTFTLKSLEAAVAPAVVERLVTTARTGPRPIKTFAKAA